MTSAPHEQRLCAPTLETERLILRALSLDDAKTIQELAGDRQIAATTALIPHPYPDGAAEAWISTHDDEFMAGKGAVWGLTLRETGDLIGAIDITINEECERAEMGYWIGVPHWGMGYMTEAAQCVLQYAFEVRNLQRVFAHHFHTNPASGRIMEKIGMKREGVLRQHFKKWGEFMDLVYYGILRDEYQDGR